MAKAEIPEDTLPLPLPTEEDQEPENQVPKRELSFDLEVELRLVLSFRWLLNDFVLEMDAALGSHEEYSLLPSSLLVVLPEMDSREPEGREAEEKRE